MKQYLAVEKLIDDDGSTGWYRLIFCAPDKVIAEMWINEYNDAFGVDAELCGELTS